MSVKLGRGVHALHDSGSRISMMWSCGHVARFDVRTWGSAFSVLCAWIRKVGGGQGSPFHCQGGAGLGFGPLQTVTTRIDGDHFEDTEWDEDARERRWGDGRARCRSAMLSPGRCDERGVGACRGRGRGSAGRERRPDGQSSGIFL